MSLPARQPALTRPLARAGTRTPYGCWEPAAEHRWALQDAGLEDDDRGLTLEQLRRDYPWVFQAEGADLAARPSAPERRRAGGDGRSPKPSPVTNLPRYDLRQ
jgi:hypothetical protein